MTPDELGIYNFRRLSPSLTTSGQPNEAQLGGLRDAGIRVVVNLALKDSPGALVDEAGTLTALGAQYIHIPVVFSAPSESDFATFVALMDDVGDTPVHIHCAANYRVSAFLYRYRTERLGWSEVAARPDLEAIWQPDAVWQKFLSRD